MQPANAIADRGILPRWAFPFLGLLLAGGVLAFLALLVQGQADRAWQIFLVNFLYWPGLAIAGVVLAAIFEATKARWPVLVRPLAERCAAYLPVAFALFLLTWFGRHSLFPWVQQPNPAISAWLNLPLLYGREAAGLLLLFGTSWVFVQRSLRSGADTVNGRKAIQWLAVSLLILYGVVYTLFAWDFAMSIQTDWYSTIFGAWFFTGNLFGGLAAVTLFTVCACRHCAVDGRLDSRTLNNLGKLLLSFALLWIYLFGSQYLVIWYGNLPHEISFILARTQSDAWKMLAAVVIALVFALPLATLLSSRARENSKVLAAVSFMILIGLWLERFLLVVPALSPGPRITVGWEELLITAGFAASFATAYVFGGRWFPQQLPTK